MAEFTQEQIDAIVAERIADVKKGLYTEEDLQKKVTSEVDRRVETGIQKGLETSKKKWEDEYKKTADMTAEELATEKLREQLSAVTTKEQEVKKKANRIEAKELLSEADIPKSHYEKFIGMLVSDDEELTKANVQNFIDMFTSTKTEIETKVKSEYSNIPKPGSAGNDVPLNKTEFDKMGYSEKLKLKQTNPELYKEFVK